MPTPSNDSPPDSPAANEPTQNAASPPSEAQPGQPATPSDAQSVNHSADGQSAAAPPKGLWSSGLRYEDAPDVPDFLRGKTAKEAADITKQLYDIAMNGPAAAQPSPSPSQDLPASQTASMPQNAQNGAQPAPPNPDLMYSDPAEYQRQLFAYQDARMQSTLAQTSQPFLASQAQMARSAARSDPERSDVWEKYAAEIDMEMSRVGLEQRASVDAWNMAADLVAGRHRRELAQDYAERAAARPDTGMEGADGGPAPGAPQRSSLDPLGQLFADDDPAVASLRERGMTEAKVRENLPKMGHTPASYAALLKKHGGTISYAERSDGRTVQTA